MFLRRNMIDVRKIDGGETRLTLESFGKFLKEDKERFNEMIGQTKDLAESFLIALRTPISEQKKCFREILEEAHRQKIPDAIVRIALSVALEKKYPRRTDLRRKIRRNIDDLLPA